MLVLIYKNIIKVAKNNFDYIKVLVGDSLFLLTAYFKRLQEDEGGHDSYLQDNVWQGQG